MLYTMVLCPRKIAYHLSIPEGEIRPEFFFDFQYVIKMRRCLRNLFLALVGLSSYSYYFLIRYFSLLFCCNVDVYFFRIQQLGSSDADIPCINIFHQSHCYFVINTVIGKVMYCTSTWLNIKLYILKAKLSRYLCPVKFEIKEQTCIFNL